MSKTKIEEKMKQKKSKIEINKTGGKVMDIYIIILLVLIIIDFIYIFLTQKNKYLQGQIENQNKIKEVMDKYSFYLKENIKLKEIIEGYEEKKYSKIDTFSVFGGEIKKDPIYKGKKALIGDYLSISYLNTEKVLRSLGFCVDIVPTVEDVVDKIKYGEHYDIIFSNNIYQHGTGEECLKELKKLENFSTPVVIHTVSKDKRDYFINTVGFDEYIVKPITQDGVKEILKKLLP